MNTRRLKPSRYPIGSVLAGKYRVEGMLGTGGMGVVLSVMHLVLRERIALKVLPSQGARPARFLREARAAAKLRGPHVARVLDAGILADGGPYIAYEHLTGQDLGVVDLPLPVAQVALLVLQLCEAIAEAHRAGIVHRDLKPANVFLTSDPDGSMVAKVLDFGLAKFVDDPSSELTHSAAVVGSPLYMAPEQIRDPRHVDVRADLWALGVLIHELLSGRRPFEGDGAAAVLAAIVADPPIPLAMHAPEAPTGLCELVSDCLIKDPDRRIPNVAEVAQRLAPFAEGGLERAERVGRILTRPLPPQEETPEASITQDPGGSASLEDSILASSKLGGVGAEASQPTTFSAGSLAPLPQHRVRPWMVGLGLFLLLGSIVLMGFRQQPTIAEAQSLTSTAGPTTGPNSPLATGETTAMALREPPAIVSPNPPHSAATPSTTPRPPPRPTTSAAVPTNSVIPYEGRHW
jgi:serine/threonine-protein kinase